MEVNVKNTEKVKQYREIAEQEAKKAQGLFSEEQYDDAADQCSSSILYSLRAIVNLFGYDADNYNDIDSCLINLIDGGKIDTYYFSISSFSMGAVSAVIEDNNITNKGWLASDLLDTAMELIYQDLRVGNKACKTSVIGR